MSDQITLPREVGEHLMWVLEECPMHGDWSERDCAALIALRAALAAPRPEPVAWRPRLSSNIAYHWIRPWQDGVPSAQTVDYWNHNGRGVEYAYAAPPAAAPEPVRHPGYVIGNHWLETAYERLCAGEAEDAILEDYELVREPRLRDLLRDAERYWWLLNWLVKTGLLTWERCRIDSPASYGDWWILRKPKVIDGSSLIGYGKTEEAAIDAAMQEVPR